MRKIKSISRPRKLALSLILKKLAPLELITAACIGIVAIGLLAAEMPVGVIPLEEKAITFAEVPQLSDSLQGADSYGLIDAEIGLSEAIQADAERRFYIALIGNAYIVEAVYTYAKDTDKDFLFALILQESRGDPAAVNVNTDEAGKILSIDRGVFQLNSNSYPDLTEKDFFRIETNIQYGISHIRGEIEYWNGDIQKALWTYNAGRAGVRSGVPDRTIAYANKILANMKSIELDRKEYIKRSLSEYTLTRNTERTTDKRYD